MYGYGQGHDGRESVVRKMRAKHSKKPRTTSFGTDQCIHVWAQRSQAWGSNAKATVWFDGDTLYSYGEHYIMARLVDTPNRATRCLINSEHSSVTTEKHKGDVKYSVTCKHYYVPCLDADRHGDQGLHRINAKWFADTFNERIADSYKKGIRKSTRVNVLEHAQSIAATHNAYVADFGLDREPLALSEEEFSRFEQLRFEMHVDECKRHLKTVNNENQSPWTRMQAMENYDRSYRAAFAVKGNRELVEGPDFEELRQQLESDHAAYLAMREQERQEQERIRALEKADKIEAWRSGEAVANYQVYDVPTMLRINGDNIQTSRGASFPIEHAVRAWPLIKRVHEQANGWDHRDCSTMRKPKLGHFAIDRISPEGDVTAGCHFVKFEEIVRMAEQLGLLPTDESICA